MRSIKEGTSRAHSVALIAVLVTACGGGDTSEASDPLSRPLVAVTGPDVRIGSPDDPAYAFRSVLRLGEFSRSASSLRLSGTLVVAA